MRGLARSLKFELLIALLVLAVVGPIVETNGAQQASRYTLTAAIWDAGTIQLDTYAAARPPVLGADRAWRDGHTYSDKAPLQPMIVVPAYAVYRAVGGEPATVRRVEGHLGLWWLKLWSSAIPGALLAALMYRWFARRASKHGAAATLAIVGGTILLPLSSVLFGHLLATLLTFVAFYLLTADRDSIRDLLWAGAAGGAAVATEYTAAIGVVVLAVYAAWRYRLKTAYYIAGGMPFVAILGVYNWVAFGSPVHLSYQWTAFIGQTSHARDLQFSFSGPSLSHLMTLLFDGRGLFIATPVVLAALVGAALAWRHGSREERAILMAATSIFLAFVLVPVSWANQWGGASPGARYMTPAMPMLAIGLPAAFERLKLFASAATGLSLLTMFAATITFPLIEPEQAANLSIWIRSILDGDLATSIFTMAFGNILGWVIHLVLIGTVAWAVFRTSRESLPIPVPG